MHIQPRLFVTLAFSGGILLNFGKYFSLCHRRNHHRLACLLPKGTRPPGGRCLSIGHSKNTAIGEGFCHSGNGSPHNAPIWPNNHGPLQVPLVSMPDALFPRHPCSPGRTGIGKGVSSSLKWSVHTRTDAQRNEVLCCPKKIRQGCCVWQGHCIKAGKWHTSAASQHHKGVETCGAWAKGQMLPHCLLALTHSN